MSTRKRTSFGSHASSETAKDKKQKNNNKTLTITMNTRGFLFVLVLSLTCTLSTPFVVPVAGRTDKVASVAGETSDLYEGFVKRGEVFVETNAADFEGDKKILPPDDSIVVDDSSLEILEVEEPLVEVRTGVFTEKFDMTKNENRIEPLDETKPLPLDYVPPVELVNY